jgi:hypothetical protein
MLRAKNLRGCISLASNRTGAEQQSSVESLEPVNGTHCVGVTLAVLSEGSHHPSLAEV